MTRTILITGSTGYLGGRVSLELFKEPGFEVRLGTYKIPNLGGDDKSYILLDILSERDLVAACEGVDSVIHLAALNEIESQSKPEQALMVNCLGTLKLLNSSIKAGIKRFIYFSTAHVYGSPLSGKITETTIAKPVHPYSISHKAAEDYVLACHAKKNLCCVVLRVSNAFGVPASSDINRWNLVVNDLCCQAVLNKKILLRTPKEVRDFVTIDDINRAVRHFLYLPFSDYGDGLFNLGGENSMKIIDMAELVSRRCSEVLDFTPDIICQEFKSGGSETKSLDYSIDKLKSTGFKLSCNINQEIDNTLKFCQKNLGKQVSNSSYIQNL